MEFKGKQGKLFVEEIKEDNLVHIVNLQGKSVASISTREDMYEEALVYCKLFSHAPELLEMAKLLVDRLEEKDLGKLSAVSRAKELIKSATE